MTALENLLKDKTLPFFDGDNKMTFLEYAIWFTNRGTNAMAMEKAAEELADLLAENETMYAAILEASELFVTAAARCKVELQRIARKDAKKTK